MGAFSRAGPSEARRLTTARPRPCVEGDAREIGIARASYGQPLRYHIGEQGDVRTVGGGAPVAHPGSCRCRSRPLSTRSSRDGWGPGTSA